MIWPLSAAVADAPSGDAFIRTVEIAARIAWRPRADRRRATDPRVRGKGIGYVKEPLSDRGCPCGTPLLAPPRVGPTARSRPLSEAPLSPRSHPRSSLTGSTEIWYSRRVLEFEWDPEKAEKNLRKHGVAFEDATEVFFDPCRQEGPPYGRQGEERIDVIGAARGRLLFVVYTMREEVIRMISARKARGSERRSYRGQFR